MEDRPKRKIIVKCLYKGEATWPVDVEFEIDRKGSLVSGSMATIYNYLKTAGFTPRWLVPDGDIRQPAAPSQGAQRSFNDYTPMCPKHNAEMKISKFEASRGSGREWYCPKKEGDGYCSEKVVI